MKWLGLDGEGIGRNPHRYVQLCYSDASGSIQDYIEDARGITTADALAFLLRTPAAHELKRSCDWRIAGYYLSYDWTMILRDLPHSSLYRLLRPELRVRPRSEGGGFSPVRWRGYELHYLSGMMRIRRGDRSVTVWDVGKFFQSRFVAALETAGLAPPELIERMKAARGTWEESDLDETLQYCLLECRWLARLVELLEKQHTAIGLDLRSYHGPGSTASALLLKYNVERCHRPDAPEIAELASRAFFGGRFEHALIGSRANVYSYDIRSAYPHAATTLPCLAHARWQHRRKAPRSTAIALVRYRVTDIGERTWGPLPCRLSDGSIVWPRGGSSGWVWNVEFQQAREGWRGVEYGGEHWELVRGCDCQPFGFIAELYRWRVERPENKQVVKLAMNSIYGKLAQSIGGGSKWSSRVWAGLITATTRARMLELIRMHGDESRLVAIATDGAYSTEALDIEGEALGEWEVTLKGYMTFVRPGIYWAHRDLLAWYGAPGDKSIADAAVKAVKARGISRAHMLTQVARAEAAIAHGEERALLGVTTQFGGARECVYRVGNTYRRSQLYGEWYQMPATLSLGPAPKRSADWTPPLLEGVESAPYRPDGPEAQKLQLIGRLLEGRIT
jgi:hypothetical protein